MQDNYRTHRIYSCAAVQLYQYYPGTAVNLAPLRRSQILNLQNRYRYFEASPATYLCYSSYKHQYITKSLCTKSWNSGGTISKIMYMLAPQIMVNLLCSDNFGLGLPVHQLFFFFFFFFLECRYLLVGTGTKYSSTEYSGRAHLQNARACCMLGCYFWRVVFFPLYLGA